jgi:hypothetical protein
VRPCGTHEGYSTRGNMSSCSTPTLHMPLAQRNQRMPVSSTRSAICVLGIHVNTHLVCFFLQLPSRFNDTLFTSVAPVELDGSVVGPPCSVLPEPPILPAELLEVVDHCERGQTGGGSSARGVGPSFEMDEPVVELAGEWLSYDIGFSV